MEKLSSSDLTISVLKADMDVSLFSCSEAELNDFLFENALLDHQHHYSVTRVVQYQNRIIGYFTLVADSISIEGLDESAYEGYAYRKLPAIKIARLATDEYFIGRGIGKYMMSEILKITFLITEYIGCKIITVDVKPNALSFYELFAFQKVKSRKTHETIPMYLDIDGLYG